MTGIPQDSVPLPFPVTHSGRQHHLYPFPSHTVADNTTSTLSRHTQWQTTPPLPFHLTHSDRKHTPLPFHVTHSGRKHTPLPFHLTHSDRKHTPLPFHVTHSGRKHHLPHLILTLPPSGPCRGNKGLGMSSRVCVTG